MSEAKLKPCSLMVIIGGNGKRRLISKFMVSRDASCATVSLQPLHKEDGPVIFLIGDDLKKVAREILGLEATSE